MNRIKYKLLLLLSLFVVLSCSAEEDTRKKTSSKVVYDRIKESKFDIKLKKTIEESLTTDKQFIPLGYFRDYKAGFNFDFLKNTRNSYSDYQGAKYVVDVSTKAADILSHFSSTLNTTSSPSYELITDGTQQEFNFQGNDILYGKVIYNISLENDGHIYFRIPLKGVWQGIRYLYKWKGSINAPSNYHVSMTFGFGYNFYAERDLKNKGVRISYITINSEGKLTSEIRMTSEYDANDRQAIKFNGHIDSQSPAAWKQSAFVLLETKEGVAKMISFQSRFGSAGGWMVAEERFNDSESYQEQSGVRLRKTSFHGFGLKDNSYSNSLDAILTLKDLPVTDEVKAIKEIPNLKPQWDFLKKYEPLSMTYE